MQHKLTVLDVTWY